MLIILPDFVLLLLFGGARDKIVFARASFRVFAAWLACHKMENRGIKA